MSNILNGCHLENSNENRLIVSFEFYLYKYHSIFQLFIIFYLKDMTFFLNTQNGG